MTKTNYKLVYDDDTGEEDLDKTFYKAVMNVRILVEEDGINWYNAVPFVADKMHLTSIEENRLYAGAESKYGVQ